MKKRNEKKILSRPKDQRIALMKSLMSSLIQYSEITTTLAKAKAFKPRAEKQISLAIKGVKNPLQKISKIRQLRKNLCQKSVSDLIGIAEAIKERKGGYLRIIKLPARKSDFAEMAKIEWVDEIKKKATSSVKNKVKAKKDLKKEGR